MWISKDANFSGRVWVYDGLLKQQPDRHLFQVVLWQLEEHRKPQAKGCELNRMIRVTCPFYWHFSQIKQYSLLWELMWTRLYIHAISLWFQKKHNISETLSLQSIIYLYRKINIPSGFVQVAKHVKPKMARAHGPKRTGRITTGGFGLDDVVSIVEDSVAWLLRKPASSKMHHNLSTKLTSHRTNLNFFSGWLETKPTSGKKGGARTKDSF